jgi:hypothetical protein
VLLTRLPLGIATSFDLHVLGTPPALVLSQDQTLHKKFYGAHDKHGSQISLRFFRCNCELHRYDLAIVTAELYVLAILKRLDHFANASCNALMTLS